MDIETLLAEYTESSETFGDDFYMAPERELDFD